MDTINNVKAKRQRRVEPVKYSDSIGNIRRDLDDLYECPGIYAVSH